MRAMSHNGGEEAYVPPCPTTPDAICLPICKGEKDFKQRRSQLENYSCRFLALLLSDDEMLDNLFVHFICHA